MELKTRDAGGEKACFDCGKSKPLADFGTNNSKPDRKAIYCRVCNGRKNRQQRDAAHAKRQAEAQARQMRLPEIAPDAAPAVADVDELVGLVRDVLRKDYMLSRRQLGRRLDRSVDEIGDALAMLWDNNEAKPERDERGEPRWKLINVA